MNAERTFHGNPERREVKLSDFNELEQQNLRPLIEAARTYLRAGAVIADGEKYIATIAVDGKTGSTAAQLTIEQPSSLSGPIAYELRVGKAVVTGEAPHEEIEFERIDYLLAGAFHLSSEHITAFMVRVPFDYEEAVARLELHQFAQGLIFIGLVVTNMTFDGLIDPPQAQSSFSGATVLNLVQRYI